MQVLQDSNALQKTPLYDRHVALNGRMVDFAGWLLPTYYRGILDEHRWTRESCSFFDVSHLGEIEVRGAGAFDFLQRRLTNDLNRSSDGKVLYNLLCGENGGILDDILVYQVSRDHYVLIVNAANIRTDWETLAREVPSDVFLKDRSHEMACVAVQGPKSEGILKKCFGLELGALGYYRFREMEWDKQALWVSRSGYTGEDGFELFAASDRVVAVWDILVDRGRKEGALPAGLGARNTLRLEAGNALYGNDLGPDTTPLEAGLAGVVSFEKGPFVGRDALLRQKSEGIRKVLAAFRMRGRAVAREHHAVFSGGRRVGIVTSGSFAPSVGANVGLAYVEKGLEKLGTLLEVEVHQRLEEAEVVRRPFIERKHRGEV